MTDPEIQAIVSFLRLAANLKTVERQGWIDRGVAAPESSADHSWAVALYAWLLARTRDDLDADRVLLLALVHDLPEALAGDATPFDLYRDEEGDIPPEHFKNAPTYDAIESRRKYQRERVALGEMLNGMPSEMARQLSIAWEEYTAGDTAEARFVRQVDKLETLVQAELYFDEQPDIVIDSFREGTDRDITDPSLREILHRVLVRRDSDSELEEETDGAKTECRR